MRLDAYLDRIAYPGGTRPNRDTLTHLLQAHVTSIPFENLDVQLGRRLSTSTAEAYSKIVDSRRGGWCYEQNGLLGWALGELGFEVTRIAAAAMREARGEVATANHLCLLVRCPDRGMRYLVDVGFGGSLWEPIELAEADHDHAPYRLGLRRLEDGFWRFYEDSGDGEVSFDFEPVAADESALAARCAFLQTNPESSFVLSLVAQIRSPDCHVGLRGRVLKTSSRTGTKTQLLSSADELLETLSSTFGLDVPEIAQAWPRIVARHEELFGAEH